MGLTRTVEWDATALAASKWTSGRLTRYRQLTRHMSARFKNRLVARYSGKGLYDQEDCDFNPYR